MYYKILLPIVSALFIITSCSTAEHLIYHPILNQGNYFSTDDIEKIQKGMTKQQVIYTLGAPILKNPFDHQVWHYVSRQKFSNKKIKQKMLICTFDHNGILNDIKIIIL